MNAKPTKDVDDVFKKVDELKVGDRIELDVFNRGIYPAKINRVYRIGGGKHFDVTIEKQYEGFFGNKKTKLFDRNYDYSRMIRNIVYDK